MTRRPPPKRNPAALLRGHRAENTLPTAPAGAGAIEYVRLESLAEMPGNPRGSHRLTKLRASLRAHGLASALTVNRTTGHVVAGNGRLSALRAMHRAGESPPLGITTDPAHPGVWFAPVIFGDWDRATEQRVALALNGGPGHSLEGEWDETTIATILGSASETDLEALGVEMRQAEQMLADYCEPIIPPVINLEGLERVPGSNSEKVTLRLEVSEALAQTARRLIAGGISADELITEGISRHDPTPHPNPAPPAQDRHGLPVKPQSAQGPRAPDPHVGRGRRPRAAKTSAPAPRSKSRARPAPL